MLPSFRMEEESAYREKDALKIPVLSTTSHSATALLLTATSNTMIVAFIMVLILCGYAGEFLNLSCPAWFQKPEEADKQNDKSGRGCNEAVKKEVI